MITIPPSMAQQFMLSVMEYLIVRRETIAGHTGLKIDHALIALREVYADFAVWVLPAEPHDLPANGQVKVLAIAGTQENEHAVDVAQGTSPKVA